MASKRNLKKDINYLTFDLLTECFTYESFHNDVKQELIDEVAKSILDNRNDLISRINHLDAKNDPKLVKETFLKIRKDFEKSVGALDKLAK